MNRQVISIFLLLLCFWTLNAFGNVAASAPAGGKETKSVLNYRAYWVASPKVISQMGGAQVSSQWSERVLPVRGKLVSVATMTTGEIKSSTGEGFPKDFTGALMQLTKIKQWKQEDRGSYVAYEALLPDQGRYLKVFVSKTKDSYKYSIASIRLAFMMPTYFEAELIQREAMGDIKGVADLQRSTFKYSAIYQMLVSPANAVGVDWIVNYLSNWQTIASNGVVSVNNVAGSVSAGAASINNVAGAVKTGATSIDGLSGSVDNINSTIKNFQSPGKMGKVAFVAGLGGALGYGLGSVLVQFATDGAVKITRELYYALTGDLKPDVRELIKQRGQKAWNSLESLAKKSLELDLEMQTQLSAMYLAGGKDPMSLADVEREIDLLQDKIKDIEKDKENNRSDSFRSTCNEQIRNMRSQLELLQNVAPILKRNRNEQALCASFDQMYDRWIDIEGELSAVRSIILNDTSAMISDAEATNREAAKDLTSGKPEKNCDFKERIRNAQNDVSNNGCVCNAAVFSGNCQSYCEILRNDQERNYVCQNMASKALNVDPIKQNAENSRRALEKAKSLERLQGQIVDSNGNYAKMQNQMTTHFREIMKACGSKTAVSEPADVQGQQKAESLLTGTLPIASASQDAVPARAEGRGFLSGLWKAISAPFRWLTGK